jgi:hypothetical protein
LTQNKPTISWQQWVALTGEVMKFEMEFGFFGNNKVLLETNDFDIIDIFQKFVEFQESHGWAVDYVAVESDDEDFEDEDTKEEEVKPIVENAHEPL